MMIEDLKSKYPSEYACYQKCKESKGINYFEGVEDVLELMQAFAKDQVKKCSIPDVSNCGNDVEKVIVDRGTLQWLYNYTQKMGEADETIAIIKHLESLGCVYK